MTNLPFPLNYIKNSMRPETVFTGRKSLKLTQILVIFIFLTSLLLIPVTLNVAKNPNISLETLMPDAFSQLDKRTMTAIKEADISEGKLNETAHTFLNEDKTVGFNLTKKEMDNLSSGISFNQTGMSLKDKSGYTFDVAYSKSFSLATSQTLDEFKNSISQEWLTQNKGFVALTLIMMSAGMIFMSELMLVIGGAFFIWVTRFNEASSIKTFRESVTLILNAMGLSSVLAMVVGLIKFDMTIVLSIQSLGLVVMLLAVFVKTRFNEDQTLRKMKQA